MTDLKKILMAFITVIMGVILIGVIADEVFRTRETFGAVSEAITLPRIHNGTGFNDSVNGTVAANITLAQVAGVGVNTPITNIVMWLPNGTSEVVTGDTVYTLDTDYNLTGSTGEVGFMAGDIALRPWPLVNDTNTTRVNYSYFHADYVENSTARVLLGLIGLFFAIGIVLALIGKFGGFKFKEMIGR